MKFSFLGANEKLCNSLPLYIYTYSSDYKQVSTDYKTGALSHHIIYTLSGTGYFKMNSKKFKIKEGDILFFKGYIPCYYEPEGNWKNCFLTFKGYGDEPLFDYYGFPDSFVFRNNEIAQKVKEISLCADNQIGEEKLSTMLYSLVNEIGLFINASETPPEYRKAVSFIQKNFTKDISLSDILKASGASHTTLYRQFYDIGKTTPFKFLTKLRIDTAKLYLKSENYSINEIAGAVGFASSNYFIETFKKQEKITPLQYRKKN